MWAKASISPPSEIARVLETHARPRASRLCELEQPVRGNQGLWGGAARDAVGGRSPKVITRARGACACLGAKHPPHTEPMAGSPLKRARRQGVRLHDGSIIAFPYMPRVDHLPSGWRHFSPEQKIEHLLGLDRCREILSWGPITELDPLRFSFQAQVMRVLLSICIKAALDGSLEREAARERNRAAVLEELRRKLRPSGSAGA